MRHFHKPVIIIPPFHFFYLLSLTVDIMPIETPKNSEKSIYNFIPFLRVTEKRKPGMSELEFRS